MSLEETGRDEYPRLPTVDEAREFLRLVNVGRAAVELEPLDVLEFDDAEPCTAHCCLSAVNLFMPTNCGYVGGIQLLSERHMIPSAVLSALEMTEDLAGTEFPLLPAAILVVTDPFDAETPGLRERLVEAGVVAP